MNEKRKPKKIWKIGEITPHMLLVLALGGVFGFYVVMQAASAISNKVETTRAVAVTENDSFQADGCFIRDESLIPAVGGEAVEYLVKDGSRVKKGKPWQWNTTAPRLWSETARSPS